MKSVLYAAAALVVATATAHAGPVSDRAGPKAPETGDRAATMNDRGSGDRMPVGLERDVFYAPETFGGVQSDRVDPNWSSNANEG